jgi:hypothetical protein
VHKVGSGGKAIFAEESAESVSALDHGRWLAECLQFASCRIGRLQVECAVRPVRVVVVDEDTEEAFEMPSVKDQEPVEALCADSADEAFGGRVRFRRAHRRLDDADAFAGEDRVEVAGELAVAVADQEAKRCRLFLERPGELARLLGDPGSGWVRGAAGQVDAAAIGADQRAGGDARFRRSASSSATRPVVPRSEPTRSNPGFTTS